MTVWQNAERSLAFYADPDTWASHAALLDPPCGDIAADMQGDELDLPGALARAVLKISDIHTEAGRKHIMQALVFYAHPGTWHAVAFMLDAPEDPLHEDMSWTLYGRKMGRKARLAVDAVFEQDADECGESYQPIDWTQEALEVQDMSQLIQELGLKWMHP